MKISEILDKYDSDKNAGVRDGVGHTYGEAFDDIFSAFDSNSKLNFLEIGVQKGGSLLAWKEYFKNAEVTGVDIKDSRVKKYISKDVSFILSDIRKVDSSIFKEKGLDIIVDDGSHYLKDVLFVVKNYVDLLNNQGVLIIEDVQAPPKWLFWINSVLLFKKNFEIILYDLRDKGEYDNFIICIKKVDSNISHLKRKNFSKVLKLWVKQFKKK